MKMNKQILKNQQIDETKDRRVAKSMVVAISCKLVQIDNEKETYKVRQTLTNTTLSSSWMELTSIALVQNL